MWRFYNYWSENLRNDVFSVLSEGVNDLFNLTATGSGVCLVFLLDSQGAL